VLDSYNLFFVPSSAEKSNASKSNTVKAQNDESTMIGKQVLLDCVWVATNKAYKKLTVKGC
jgi:hypothetical protein